MHRTEHTEGKAYWLKGDAFDASTFLVNNAAVNDRFESPAETLERSQFENYPLEHWKLSLDVNVTGVFLCSRTNGARMAARGHGSIINIASTYGLVAPDSSLYRDRHGQQRFW
ncbi:MAG: SDR family NAD(P)-dependent oxidoreductase [Chromatiales bacterium]